MTTPSFALIGAVNHGKSSIAATLLEDDNIGISGDPGKTLESQRFDYRDGGLAVWDTPGFQDPRSMLAEIQAAVCRSNKPLDVFQDFATRHAVTGIFVAERELLRPLLLGAGILYVVDTSRPLMRVHEAEMELIRLTGLPRLAILNPTGPAEHDSVWRAKLGQNFSAVHEFNALKAGIKDRADLLRTMGTVADKWKDLLIAVANKVETVWKSRLEDASQLIVELVDKCVSYESNVSVAPGDDIEAAVCSLKVTFYDHLQAEEKKSREYLRKLFLHHRESLTLDIPLPNADDLFSEETWKVFGLTWPMLFAGGSVAGVCVGAKTGLIVGAIGEAAAPTGIPTTIGTVVGGMIGLVGGGVAAVTLGKRVAQPSIKKQSEELSDTTAQALSAVWSVFQRLGRKALSNISKTGTQVTVGPLKGENFPYILLDRAIDVVWHFASRTHARRDKSHIDRSCKVVLDEAKAYSQHWPAELRQACSGYLRSINKGTPNAKHEEDFRKLLAEHLGHVCEATV